MLSVFRCQAKDPENCQTTINHLVTLRLISTPHTFPYPTSIKFPLKEPNHLQNVSYS